MPSVRAAPWLCSTSVHRWKNAGDTGMKRKNDAGRFQEPSDILSRVSERENIFRNRGTYCLDAFQVGYYSLGEHGAIYLPNTVNILQHHSYVNLECSSLCTARETSSWLRSSSLFWFYIMSFFFWGPSSAENFLGWLLGDSKTGLFLYLHCEMLLSSIDAAPSKCNSSINTLLYQKNSFRFLASISLQWKYFSSACALHRTGV